MYDRQEGDSQLAEAENVKMPQKWLARAIRTWLLAMVLVFTPSVSEVAHPYRVWLYVASAILFVATGIAVFLACLSANKLEG